MDEHGEVHCIGCPKGKVVNSVGAGDSMVAGFVAGWMQTRQLFALHCVWAQPAAVPPRSALGLPPKKKSTN
ncbi:MAG: PfkB family carbohydrate kinase [Faecalibacterium prausnitzii]